MNSFVRSAELLDWGIGRVVLYDETPDTVELEFFVSPTEGFEHATVAWDSLRRVTLERQTRVYVSDDETGVWLPGRLAATGLHDASALDAEQFPDAPTEGKVYVVAFPGGVERALVPERIHVRWDMPISSPVPWLASRTHDGPFLFRKRSAVLREILRQRAAFAGMTSLASASVELYEHQFRAAQTVLHDPIMRYVLADEVGLGKTIEAGIVIRQHILDEPQGARVLVLTPEHLVQQWKDELDHRLSLSGEYSLSVAVGSLAQISELSEDMDGSPSMLVVDEAHQAANLAASSAKGERAIYHTLAGLAHEAAHVLLLSATPILRNEAGFLAMLHLLDPVVHQLEAVDEFRELVRKSQNFGSVVALLRPSQNSALLGRALRHINELSSGSGLIQELADRLGAVIDLPRESEERDPAIARLRLHIQEVYRVHHRLVRTSRGDPTANDYLPSGRVCEGLPYEDPLRQSSYYHLEAWRSEVLGEIPHPEQRGVARAVFSDWVEASLIHPHELREGMSVRLRQLRAGGDAPFFSHEAELIEEVVSDLEQPDSAFVDILVQDVQRRVRDIGKKALVFTSSVRTAESIRLRLENRVAGAVVRIHEGNFKDTAQFLGDPGLAVLIIDQRAEEGLNLQQVNATLVHADLPLSAVRVEQRLGRVDRLQAVPIWVTSSVPYADSGYEKAVFALLKASGVFTKSVAPLQYLLNEIVQHIRTRLLEEGTDVIEEVCARMVDHEHEFCLEAEEKSAARLRILDEMDRTDEGNDLYQALEDYEYGSDVRAFSVSIQDWLGPGCLGLKARKDGGRIRFAFSEGASLLTKSQFLQYFRTALDPGVARATTYPMSFDRSDSAKLGVPLARIGHPLIDGLERQARSDERGMAYAVWRRCPRLSSEFEPSVFFRFDFLIEASIDTSMKALRRRADNLLPPRFETVWINSELAEESDMSLLEVLSMGIESRALGTVDSTLHAHTTWKSAEQILSVPWADLCDGAEQAARRALEGRSSISDACATALDALRDRLARTETILLARRARITDGHGAGVDDPFRAEAASAEKLELAISRPRTHLEFVGAIFLSRDPLPAIDEGE